MEPVFHITVWQEIFEFWAAQVYWLEPGLEIITLFF